MLLAATWVSGEDPDFFGDMLDGLTAEEKELFADGLEDFEEVETVEEGLGPVFNDRSCAACHSVPAIGGGSDVVETRFGRTKSGLFDPLPESGGSLIQTTGIKIADGSLFNFDGELVPAKAKIRAGRRTTPLFGLGLVDAVPDATFYALAAQQAIVTPATAGRPNVVKNLATGLMSVGKFGWKGQVPSLFVFSADAYLNEMGITSPMFPDESCPSGDCGLLRHNPFPGLNDTGDGVEAFKNFMTFLGPPPQAVADATARAGEAVFQQVGCGNCHVPTLETGPNATNPLNRVAFHPYSDFLLHDMGTLGDGIEQGLATGREMRTAPLWGLRAITSFLHDGRARTAEDAILAHAGQGAAARNTFSALSPQQKQQLIAFLNTL